MLGTFLGTTHLTSLPKNYEHHPFPLHLSVCLSVSGPSVARHGQLSVRPPPATGPSTAQAMTIPVQVPWNHPTDQTRPSDTWLVSRVCEQTKARNISHPVSPTPRPFRFPPPDTTPGQGQMKARTTARRKDTKLKAKSHRYRPLEMKKRKKEIRRNAETTGAGLAQGNTQVINNSLPQPPPLEVSPPKTKSSNHPTPSPSTPNPASDTDSSANTSSTHCSYR